MRFLKNISLATRLYALVASFLLLAAVLVLQSAQQVKGTEGVLKYTIDNRMMSVQSLESIADALLVARDASRSVVDGTLEPAAAAAQIESEVEQARDAWDRYFLAEMLEDEQRLADDTTPVLDTAWSAIDKVVRRLRDGNLAGLEALRTAELRPAIAAATENIKALTAMQITAAQYDQERAAERANAAFMRSIVILVAGVLGGLALAWLVIRGVMRQLGADPAAVTRVAQRIAEGDYDLQIGKVDDRSLMAALGRMKDSLALSRLDYEGQLAAIGSVQAVVEFTPEGVVTRANENFLKLMGYEPEDLKGKHHSVFVNPAEREKPEYRAFWSGLASGQPQVGVFRRITRAGAEVWVSGVYAPIRDRDGRTFKVVKYVSDVTTQRQTDRLNAAFKGALQKLSASVMVADNDGNVIYANEAVRELMTNAQDDIRRTAPQFDPNALVGKNMDMFHRNPAHQRKLMEALTSTYANEIKVGSRTLRIVANPMRDETGTRLGTVVEWFDRTQELGTETELQEVIDAVTAGDLSRRIDLVGKSGFFETLSKGINGLVDSVAVVVDEVQEIVAAANEGDLRRRIRLEGRTGLLVKIGTGINQLTDNMASVVAQVKQAAAEVSRGADEISQGNTNLSQRTEEQASSLEETASSMEQMTSTVKQNADNAGQANQLAVAARDQAEKGGAVVAKAVKAMSEINEASKKIADIIGVIDEIAFQTNLLALNAAVEAARAGEQGRGFAVVASEVRNLAGRSATAAKEIKALIQDSVKKVDEGSSLVTQSGSTLDQIVAAVKKVTDIVAEIAAASHEQSAGIDQVSKAVMQLDELTQQNAALVEQASAASQAMAEQARQLNEQMSRYTVLANTVTEARALRAADAAAAAPQVTVERRKGNRPWSRKRSSEAAAPSATVAAAAGDDTVWKEF
jgi:methyl-accepting chemotaxis protein